MVYRYFCQLQSFIMVSLNHSFSFFHFTIFQVHFITKNFQYVLMSVVVPFFNVYGYILLFHKSWFDTGLNPPCSVLGFELIGLPAYCPRWYKAKVPLLANYFARLFIMSKTHFFQKSYWKLEIQHMFSLDSQNYAKHFYSESVPQRGSVKQVFKTFTKFTGKHLHQSPFFNKVAGLS